MKSIYKADVVGARIVDIHEVRELKDGCDCSVIYFTVDRGFTFVLPTAEFPWTTDHLPANAKRLEDEIVSEAFEVRRGWFGLTRLVPLPSTMNDNVKQIKQRIISGVYCGRFDEDLECHYPSIGTIVFEDGSQASNNMAAPHGTGGAGLYFFNQASGRCTPTNELVDYFSIPVTHDHDA